MDLISLLAAASEQAPVAVSHVDSAKELLYDGISRMHWLLALLLLSMGVVYLLYGWRIFRTLVVISFGFIGMFLGMILADKLSTNAHAVLWGGIIGTALLSVVAIPLMKWCVSFLGAIAGGILTSGVWIALGLSEGYLPAGFIVGFIAGGLMSFIMLKISVMLFSSLGGAFIMLLGSLSLLYQYDKVFLTSERFYADRLIYEFQWFLPLFLIVLTVVGMFFQNKFIKQSPSWEM